MADEDAETAFEQIIEAAELGNGTLDFSGLQLAEFPDTVQLPIDLLDVSIEGTRIYDLDPLSGLTALLNFNCARTPVRRLDALATLTTLESVDLSGTGITDISPLVRNDQLNSIAIQSTGIADISPLIGKELLSFLDADGSAVSDLRPILETGLALEEGAGRQRSIRFRNTPACADRAVAAAALIEDDGRRLQTLLAHLRTLPPWPEPLAAQFDDAPATGPAPDKPALPPLPVLRLTEDNRIDLPRLELPEGIDTALLERLYDRLRRDLNKLSRFVNRYDGLAEIVQSMNRSLGNEFDSLDYLNLHLDLGELFDLRDAEPNGADPWDTDARAAADAVLRSGPGLTVAHPDIEAYEKSVATYYRRPSPPTAYSERKIVEDLSNDPSIATEATQAFSKRVATAEFGRLAEMRQAFTKNAIAVLSVVGTGLANAAQGAVFGELLKSMVPAAKFLWLHRNEVMAIAQDWGGQAGRWADYVLRQARDIVERAKNTD